ncbi:acyl-[acyl-carrier-protein]--UDP-N-acetylglucosamine O-acyltransferase [Helicobacter monodelphidis]|uniref:acyl-ACP--UDP-N-acetylglucosamine O-acyltransferase n=1 Tax=Helicobacter sp. 15-1451 TaxID=2004995 RepID=UPI000DCED664|nr:acyl-ACP--UDP-N-acetylglucosamine O-acyltransferase [Helicobacter sp. 15-1451]RAX56743.1 acyl-[acyl-carrier-protein]--UDP-N-acetylglucosamine O-acyltransferase [Helicobacter sp. 15-1451]
MRKIAPTAIIEEGAEIADDVEIGHFCVIGEEVKIGKGTKLYNNVTLAGRTTLGEDNILFPYAVLGTDPQDLKYNGEKSELIIGNHNLIREFTMFSPGTAGDQNQTIIGDHNLFMAYVHIAHDCVIGNHCILANNATLAGHIHLGDYVNVGGLTGIHQFVKVGDGAMVAGASALGQDVPPFCIAEGNRAVLRGLNRHRLRLLFDNDEIDRIANLYKKLFSGKRIVREVAEEELSLNNPFSPNIEKMCKFILESKRGIPVINRNARSSSDEQ